MVNDRHRILRSRRPFTPFGSHLEFGAKPYTHDSTMRYTFEDMVDERVMLPVTSLLPALYSGYVDATAFYELIAQHRPSLDIVHDRSHRNTLEQRFDTKARLKAGQLVNAHLAYRAKQHADSESVHALAEVDRIQQAIDANLGNFTRLNMFLEDAQQYVAKTAWNAENASAAYEDSLGKVLDRPMKRFGRRIDHLAEVI